MFELDEKRLKYEMRTNSRFRNHHGNLFGMLALSSSQTLESGMHFSKAGFLTETQFKYNIIKPICKPLKDLSDIRQQFKQIHILNFLAS